MSEYQAQVAAHKARRARIAAAAVQDRGINIRNGWPVKFTAPIVQVEPTPVDVGKTVEQAMQNGAIAALPAPAKKSLSIYNTGLFLAPIEVIGREEPRVSDIQKAVMDAFGIDVIDFFSMRRTREVVVPRQIAMALVKKLTTRTLPDIGRRFGGRDHTTILHAIRKITPLLERVAPALGDSNDPCAWATAIKADLDQSNFIKHGPAKEDDRRATSRKSWKSYYEQNGDLYRYARRHRITITEARAQLTEQAKAAIVSGASDSEGARA